MYVCIETTDANFTTFLGFVLQCDLETATFGLNQTGVKASIEKQRKHHKDIVNYKKEIDTVTRKPVR